MAERNLITQIPNEIPTELFLHGSVEEFCRNVRAERLNARKAKYGEDATLPETHQNDGMTDLAFAAQESLSSRDRSPSKTKNYRFAEPESKSTIFASPARGAASVVALLVIGIACYSTYFGA